MLTMLWNTVRTVVECAGWIFIVGFVVGIGATLRFNHEQDVE